MADDNFFAVAPPEGDAPPAEAGDAPIVLGVPPEASSDDFFGAPPAAAEETGFVGDVNETANAYTAAPTDAFAAPPADDAFGGDAFAAPPAEDTPIILGGAPPVEDADPEDIPAEEAVVATGPSPMQKWNEEWQETLKTRKDEENNKKAELLEAARVALENFQKEREIKREAKMAKNREDEQAKLEAIEADLENDNSWQRVCKMVELSHDSTESAEDVKRMRDALIYLKNDTARAEVLAS